MPDIEAPRDCDPFHVVPPHALKKIKDRAPELVAAAKEGDESWGTPNNSGDEYLKDLIQKLGDKWSIGNVSWALARIFGPKLTEASTDPANVVELDPKDFTDIFLMSRLVGCTYWTGEDWCEYKNVYSVMDEPRMAQYSRMLAYCVVAQNKIDGKEKISDEPL